MSRYSRVQIPCCIRNLGDGWPKTGPIHFHFRELVFSPHAHASQLGLSLSRHFSPNALELVRASRLLNFVLIDSFLERGVAHPLSQRYLGEFWLVASSRMLHSR